MKEQIIVMVTIRRNGHKPKTVPLEWTPGLHCRQEAPGYPGWTIFKIVFP